jgi:hypothetical protein
MVSAAIAGNIHYTDCDKDQHQTPAAGDAVKSVMKTNGQVNRRSAKACVVHKQTHRRATVPQTGVLERRELVNARSDKDGRTEPTGVAAS